ncbi:hypothetical protein [Yoonia vestfoldensis]|uniref:hypothetical protein n=1 Tax=Yoonia vestfoldensis TaxID=245188 RepID=UPI0013A56562|nr:hypothetical protein [Yoonia vestfoldensis]
MAEKTFALLFEAISAAETGFRIGARHAILAFARGQNGEDAKSRAADRLHANGWLHPNLKKVKEAGNPDHMSDDILRSAAHEAQKAGFGFVVYREEIRPDA